ncbi:hypothetical protein M0R45_006527 [Rubus argutus]|uniref:Uncharacterized protein n=1 Tax=Rubus argutus TaxID=59490 RepID=A0AAW1YQT2_RUBAR
MVVLGHGLCGEGAASGTPAMGLDGDGSGARRSKLGLHDLVMMNPSGIAAMDGRGDEHGFEAGLFGGLSSFGSGSVAAAERRRRRRRRGALVMMAGLLG